MIPGFLYDVIWKFVGFSFLRLILIGRTRLGAALGRVMQRSSVVLTVLI